MVPDAPDVVTSNAGWDTIKNQSSLTEIIAQIRQWGIRTSLFIDPDPVMIKGAAQTGADRIELYTESYAKNYPVNSQQAIGAYREAAEIARKMDLGINAGHDLDLQNLKFFKQEIPFTDEVSIGHAIICDSIYLGLENTIQLYLRQLN